MHGPVFQYFLKYKKQLSFALENQLLGLKNQVGVGSYEALSLEEVGFNVGGEKGIQAGEISLRPLDSLAALNSPRTCAKRARAYHH